MTFKFECLIIGYCHDNEYARPFLQIVCSTPFHYHPRVLEYLILSWRSRICRVLGSSAGCWSRVHRAVKPGNRAEPVHFHPVGLSCQLSFDIGLTFFHILHGFNWGTLYRNMELDLPAHELGSSKDSRYSSQSIVSHSCTQRYHRTMRILYYIIYSTIRDSSLQPQTVHVT